MKSILLSLILLSSITINAQELVMKVINPRVNQNIVTYDVTTDHFTDMISSQYSIKYDTSLMTFVALENLNLEDLSLQCFNTNIPGLILHSWYQHNLDGVTVDSTTIIYQISFDMKNNTYGNVCFSENPLVSEFARAGENIISFNVVDDCHPSPFQIILGSSGTEDVAYKNGLDINNVAFDHILSFTLAETQVLTFQVFDFAGKQISAFTEKMYPAGKNNLDLNNVTLPGMYLLTTRIKNQLTSHKFYNRG